MSDMTRAARDAIMVANETYTKYTSPKRREHTFEVGSKVLLSTKFFRPPADKERRRKLSSKYAGPFEIVKVISPVAYQLQLPVGTNVHNVFHASLLRPYHADTTGTRQPVAPAPLLVEGEVEYIVDKILDHRRRRKKTEWLVHWKGYPLSEASWEPTPNVAGSTALEVYQAEHPDALA